jgi:hypothetical protein
MPGGAHGRCQAGLTADAKHADFRMQFGVPDQWTPIGAIAIGHPDPASDPFPPARASDRKSLDELVRCGMAGPGPLRASTRAMPARPAGVRHGFPACPMRPVRPPRTPDPPLRPQQ